MAEEEGLLRDPWRGRPAQIKKAITHFVRNVLFIWTNPHSSKLGSVRPK
ncbi:MAG: hypothetical protein ABFS28_13745 [Bacteroidota bacterium]